MIAINFELIFLISIPLMLILVYFINKKFRIFDTWISTIKKTGPLFLIFFPVCFTYLFVCGAFSAVMVLVYTSIRGKDHMVREEFLLIEDIVEFLCSFLVPLFYYRILTKRGFPVFWTFIIAATHILAAGYRDAKYIYTPAAGAEKSHFESGPIILEHMQLLDASIPLIGLLLFLFFFKKRWEPLPIGSSEVPAGSDSTL
jgi:hypothetical protein